MRLKERLHQIFSSLGPGGKSAAERLYSLVPIQFRKKRGFWKYLEFLRKSQWEPTEWHYEYQLGQLRALLKYVSEFSPYYQQLFASAKCDINDIKSMTDFRMIPVLDKSTLIKRVSEFLPTAFPKSQLVVNSTSGSTGTPFKFYQDYYAVMREEAFAVRHWENAGMVLGDPVIYLRSYIPNHPDAFHKYSAVDNRHYFSAYHLGQHNLSFYLDKLKKIKAKFIFGYPSSLEILSDLLLESGELLNCQSAITGSEMLSNNARVKIEKALNTKVYDWYGLAEPAVTIGQCEQGSYHVFSEYGILELLDSDNNPVTTDGQVGRIVGTNFTNRALPLIRYDTGDLGTYTSKSCSCGRGTPVIVSSIEGRKDDLLIGSSGQFLPSVNFYSLFAKLGSEITRFQLVQNDKSKFNLKLIRGPEFSESSVNKILTGLNERIGGRPEIQIDDVDKIAPTKAGKIRAVVRKYNPAEAVTGSTDEN